MTRLAFVAVGAFVLALTGCNQAGTGDDTAGTADGAGNVAANMAQSASTGATARLQDANGQQKGVATATQAGDAVRMRLAVGGLAPGAYAAHIHTTGACEPPKFESAGPHWNPTNAQHGTENPAGAHKGDLPNITIGADGVAQVDFTVPAATLRGGANALLDADGAAVMIHAKADDYRTDPSGNAGDRIACGVLG